MFVFNKLKLYIINYKYSTRAAVWMIIRYKIENLTKKMLHINSIPRGIFLHHLHNNITLVSIYHYRKKYIEIFKNHYDISNTIKHTLFLSYLVKWDVSDPHYIIHKYDGKINFVIEGCFRPKIIYDFEQDIKIYTLTKFVDEKTFAYNITDYKRGVRYRSYNESIIKGYPMFRSILENNLFIYIRKPINSNNTLYYDYYGKPLNMTCVVYFNKEIESFIIGYGDKYRVYSLPIASLPNINLLKNIYHNAFDLLDVYYTTKIYNPDTRMNKISILRIV